MLLGRLGLDTARLPHEIRHGLVYLDRGRLEVEDGCLRFVCAGGGACPPAITKYPISRYRLCYSGPAAA